MVTVTFFLKTVSNIYCGRQVGSVSSDIDLEKYISYAAVKSVVERKDSKQAVTIFPESNSEG